MNANLHTDFSSDSSSSEDELPNKNEEVEDSDDEALEINAELADEDENDGSVDMSSASVHPKTLIPKELNLEKTKSDTEFENYYTQLMTKEFGDDLNKLRQSKDFTDSSLFLLVRALKQGANIFDDTQRKQILQK